jgi:hypothetical protein
MFFTESCLEYQVEMEGEESSKIASPGRGISRGVSFFEPPLIWRTDALD